MKKTAFIFFFLVTVVVVSGCSSKQDRVRNIDYSGYANEYHDEELDYDDGYSWAEDNDIDNFDDCQYEFGTSDEEDGCNDYVKDNHTGYDTFYGYDCTEDCSGHEAGYSWAEDNDIDDTYDCDGNSQSFIEGCEAYVEENY
jgi:hypothetical protein